MKSVPLKTVNDLLGDSSQTTSCYTQLSLELIDSEDWGSLTTSCTTGITDMSWLFSFAYFSFNHDIGSWDVSHVSNMEMMFYEAYAFNQDIGSWDVSNVSNMTLMFCYAQSFNQDIGGWNLENVTDMGGMFYYAQSFNQDLSSWCVSNLSTEPGNFAAGATNWTEPQPTWGTCP